MLTTYIYNLIYTILIYCNRSEIDQGITLTFVSNIFVTWLIILLHIACYRGVWKIRRFSAGKKYKDYDVAPSFVIGNSLRWRKADCLWEYRYDEWREDAVLIDGSQINQVDFGD